MKLAIIEFPMLMREEVFRSINNLLASANIVKHESSPGVGLHHMLLNVSDDHPFAGKVVTYT
jgi:hypothetical protein